MLSFSGSVYNFLHFCVLFILAFNDGHYLSYSYFVHVVFISNLVF